jgi:hypothetical protein
LHDQQDPDTLCQGADPGSVGGVGQQQCQAVEDAKGPVVSHDHSGVGGPAQSVHKAQCAWCGGSGVTLGSGPVSKQPCLLCHRTWQGGPRCVAHLYLRRGSAVDQTGSNSLLCSFCTASVSP